VYNGALKPISLVFTSRMYGSDIFDVDDTAADVGERLPARLHLSGCRPSRKHK